MWLSLKESPTSQASPSRPWLQEHVPVLPSHVPCPRQSRGQDRKEQSGPHLPLVQEHALLVALHEPWPEHASKPDPGHTGTLQVGPEKAWLHKQVAVAKSHAPPWGLHAGEQTLPRHCGR